MKQIITKHTNTNCIHKFLQTGWRHRYLAEIEVACDERFREMKWISVAAQEQPFSYSLRIFLPLFVSVSKTS